MSDILISHSQQDRDVAQTLASFLDGQGRSVSRHCNGPSGELEANAMTMLSNARAVLPIWSKSSLSSPYVLQDAIVARDRRTLVHVIHGVEGKQIPFREAGPVFDATDLLQISLALLPYCRLN